MESLTLLNQVLFVAKGRFSDEQVIAFNTFKDFISETGITKFTTIAFDNLIKLISEIFPVEVPT